MDKKVKILFVRYFCFYKQRKDMDDIRVRNYIDELLVIHLFVEKVLFIG